MTPASITEAPLSLRIAPGGGIQWVYDERFDLSSLGPIHLRRASHVEPDADGWWADLSPVHGPILGPFACRSAALAAERAWLEQAAVWPPQPATEAATQPPEPSIPRRTQPMRIIMFLIVLIVLMSFVGCLDQMAMGANARLSKPHSFPPQMEAP